MDLNSKKAKVSLFLDTRREKANGVYPVKLRVYFNKAKMYDIGQSLTESDFAASYWTTKPKGKFLDTKISLVAVEADANEIITDMKLFSFEKFEKLMFKVKVKGGNLIDHYETYITALNINNQISTLKTYRCSINSLQAFINDGRKTKVSAISFESISSDFLNCYEQWMIMQDKTKTTIGIYLRPLKRIYNVAIKEGSIPTDIYPFKNYKIPTGKNVKKALERTELRLIYDVQLSENSAQKKARDFWFFSYQCNGMNFRDIAELRFKDITDTYFTFLRHKTKNTTKEDPISIFVPITDKVQWFIDKYANKKGKPNEYLFPIFKNGMTETEKHRTNVNFIRFTNQHMQKLVNKIGLDIKIGTMTARHTFTTLAVRERGLEFAQEALGHTTMATTQNYWKGFENPVKRDVANKLMDF